MEKASSPLADRLEMAAADLGVNPVAHGQKLLREAAAAVRELNLSEEELFAVKCMRGRAMTGCDRRNRGQLTYFWVDGVQPSEGEIREHLGDADPVKAAEKYLARYERFGGGRGHPEKRKPPLEHRMFNASVQFGIAVPTGQGVDEVAFGKALEKALELARQNGELELPGQMPEGVAWVCFIGLEDGGIENPIGGAKA